MATGDRKTADRALAPEPFVPAGGWAGPREPRMPVPPPAERGALFRTVARLAALFDRPELPVLFPVLHQHPRLFWGWLYFASRLMPYGRLPAAVREKLILRTAWNCRSRYEWGQHVDLALTAGVRDDEIVALTRAADAIADEGDRLLARACDELCSANVLSDATWAALAARFERKLLIELTLLVGHYRMLAGFLSSAGLTLEAPIEARLQAFFLRAGP